MPTQLENLVPRPRPVDLSGAASAASPRASTSHHARESAPTEDLSSIKERIKDRLASGETCTLAECKRMVQSILAASEAQATEDLELIEALDGSGGGDGAEEVLPVLSRARPRVQYGHKRAHRQHPHRGRARRRAGTDGGDGGQHGGGVRARRREGQPASPGPHRHRLRVPRASGSSSWRNSSPRARPGGWRVGLGGVSPSEHFRAAQSPEASLLAKRVCHSTTRVANWRSRLC